MGADGKWVADMVRGSFVTQSILVFQMLRQTTGVIVTFQVNGICDFTLFQPRLDSLHLLREISGSLVAKSNVLGRRAKQ